MTDELVNQIAATYLFPALVAFTGVVAYAFGIRPLLKQSPRLRHLYGTEDTAINAVKVKLTGVKQKMTTVVVTATGFILLAHDEIVSVVQEAGVNIDPTLILPKVPVWVWPLTSILAVWLLQYFRHLADKQARANAEALLNAGHSLAAAAPGLSVHAQLPSPSPLATLPDKEV